MIPYATVNLLFLCLCNKKVILREFQVVFTVSATGLPTKDETSETTVRNVLYTLYFLLFTIPCKCKFVWFFAKSLNKPIYCYI